MFLWVLLTASHSVPFMRTMGEISLRSQHQKKLYFSWAPGLFLFYGHWESLFPPLLWARRSSELNSWPPLAIEQDFVAFIYVLILLASFIYILTFIFSILWLIYLYPIYIDIFILFYICLNVLSMYMWEHICIYLYIHEYICICVIVCIYIFEQLQILCKNGI